MGAGDSVRTGDLRAAAMTVKCIQLVTGRGVAAGTIRVVFIGSDLRAHQICRFYAGDLLAR